MLKRSIWLILVLCLFLTACGTGTPTAMPTETATATADVTPTPQITPAPTSAITSSSDGYVTFRPDLDTTSKASYVVIPIRDTTPIVSQQDRVLIEYPQIRNLGNSAKEAELNKMLKDHFFDSITLKEKDYVKNCPADLSLGYYTGEITFDVVMQTKELLSIVYDNDLHCYEAGGPETNRGLDISNNFAITIDLKNMKRLSLSNFTSTSIEVPEEHKGESHIDIYYRILNSKTVYDQHFRFKLSPEYDYLWKNSDYATKEEYEESIRSRIGAGLPFCLRTSAAPFQPYSEFVNDFFIREDGVYFITHQQSRVAPDTKGSAVYVKILAETEWEWPLG